MNFVYNDAGRSLSRRPKQSNDCTVRALALVANLSYDRAYEILASAGRKSGCRFDFDAWCKIPNILYGFHIHIDRLSFPAVKGQRRMNPETFCATRPSGRYVVRTAKHCFAIIDGVIYDTIEPRPDRCIYLAWKFWNSQNGEK